MKTRTFVSILILVLAVLIIAGGCATGKKAQMPEEELFKKLSGTWVNEEYNQISGVIGMGWPVKLVVYSDGTYEWFGEASDRIGYGEYEAIVDTWTDSRGNLFYKATFNVHLSTSVFYQFGMINSSGTEWESVASGVNFPAEIGPKYGLHAFYYRQE
jgi:hypothetical protein